MSFHVPNEYRLKNHPTLSSTDSDGNNGVFIFSNNGYEISCIASDGIGWEHVSVTINRNRTPSWETMHFVKTVFWDDEDTVMQLHPSKSQYVNQHPNCLHLWKQINFELPLPQPIQV